MLTHSLDDKLAILDTSRPMGAPQRVVCPVWRDDGTNVEPWVRQLGGERVFDLVFIESDGDMAIAFYEEKEKP